MSKKKKNRDKRTHRENQLPGRNAQLNTSLKQRSEDAKTLVSEHKTHYQRKKKEATQTINKHISRHAKRKPLRVPKKTQICFHLFLLPENQKIKNKTKMKCETQTAEIE